MWATDGCPRQIDEDAFNRVQQGPAWALTYYNPEHPDQRLVSTIGVVINRAGQYTGYCEFERQEQISAGMWERVRVSDESGLFYEDHDTYRQALIDAESELQRWKAFAFDDAVWNEQVPNE